MTEIISTRKYTDPNHRVPKLVGQHADYIDVVPQAYRAVSPR